MTAPKASTRQARARPRAQPVTSAARDSSALAAARQPAAATSALAASSGRKCKQCVDTACGGCAAGTFGELGWNVQGVPCQVAGCRSGRRATCASRVPRVSIGAAAVARAQVAASRRLGNTRTDMLHGMQCASIARRASSSPALDRGRARPVAPDSTRLRRAASRVPRARPARLEHTAQAAGRACPVHACCALQANSSPTVVHGTCMNCARGRYAGVGAAGCKKCATGRYQTHEGRSLCHACDTCVPGTIAATAATQVVVHVGAARRANSRWTGEHRGLRRTQTAPRASLHAVRPPPIAMYALLASSA